MTGHRDCKEAKVFQLNVRSAETRIEFVARKPDGNVCPLCDFVVFEHFQRELAAAESRRQFHCFAQQHFRQALSAKWLADDHVVEIQQRLALKRRESLERDD